MMHKRYINFGVKNSNETILYPFPYEKVWSILGLLSGFWNSSSLHSDFRVEIGVQSVMKKQFMTSDNHEENSINSSVETRPKLFANRASLSFKIKNFTFLTNKKAGFRLFFVNFKFFKPIEKSVGTLTLSLSNTWSTSNHSVVPGVTVQIFMFIVIWSNWKKTFS